MNKCMYVCTWVKVCVNMREKYNTYLKEDQHDETKLNIIFLHALYHYDRCVQQSLYVAYYQILMSVQQALLHAINKPCVWTLMEITPVHVIMDTLEMGELAMVSMHVFV